MSANATGWIMTSHRGGDAPRDRRDRALAVALVIPQSPRMVFRVQQQAETWLVRLGSDTWGEYLGRAQALRIANFAARDARRQGYHAMVWDGSRRLWHS
jgi:hypothetical protein